MKTYIKWERTAIWALSVRNKKFSEHFSRDSADFPASALIAIGFNIILVNFSIHLVLTVIQLSLVPKGYTPQF